MDTSLSILCDIVKDREAWHAAFHGVAKRWTWLSHWTATTVNLWNQITSYLLPKHNGRTSLGYTSPCSKGWIERSQGVTSSKQLWNVAGQFPFDSKTFVEMLCPPGWGWGSARESLSLGEESFIGLAGLLESSGHSQGCTGWTFKAAVGLQHQQAVSFSFPSVRLGMTRCFNNCQVFWQL